MLESGMVELILPDISLNFLGVPLIFDSFLKFSSMVRIKLLNLIWVVKKCDWLLFSIGWILLRIFCTLFSISWMNIHTVIVTFEKRGEHSSLLAFEKWDGLSSGFWKSSRAYKDTFQKKRELFSHFLNPQMRFKS